MEEIIEFGTRVQNPLTRERFNALHNYIKDNIECYRAKNALKETNSSEGEPHIDWEYYDYILDRIADWCNDNNIDFVEVAVYYNLKDIIGGNYNV